MVLVRRVALSYRGFYSGGFPHKNQSYTTKTSVGPVNAAKYHRGGSIFKD